MEKRHMFIKLTRIDGSPVWINASFVVTVEPAHGGSLVVPVGDGLDYDVRETPEEVLSMLEGAPVAAILPVPAVDALAPQADDVSPEEGEKPAAEPPGKDAKPATAKKTATRKTAATKRRTTKKKAAEPAPLLADEQVARLSKMKPGRIAAFNNTLTAQFKVAAADTDAVREWLVEKGVVAVDGVRLNWL